MRATTYSAAVCLLALSLVSARAEKPKPVAEPKAPASPDWSLNATIIESCSCPMLCPCFFGNGPSGGGLEGHEGHGHPHFCRLNNAYKVNHGHYGATKLDGAKFWLSGDLGDDLSKGEMDWAVLTFDPSVSKEQREGIKIAVDHVYPFKWKSFTVGKDAPVDWKAGKDAAEAKLDGGKVGEVSLKRMAGMTDEPIVVKNMRYYAAPRNDGFLLMPSELEAWRTGEKAFEYKGTNGFMVTIDVGSKDAK